MDSDSVQNDVVFKPKEPEPEKQKQVPKLNMKQLLNFRNMDPKATTERAPANAALLAYATPGGAELPKKEENEKQQKASMINSKLKNLESVGGMRPMGVISESKEEKKEEEEPLSKRSTQMLL